MGWSILTGIVAITAVVAEIGEVFQLPGGKRSAEFHGWENRAETFTVPACIAYR